MCTAPATASPAPPLTGGNIFTLPLGTFYTPNLTPDRETGIGRRKDGELARILRYGVRADGRAALPFMEFHEMSDDDLQAVISFLRSQPAIRNKVRQHEPTFLGKAILAFVMKPIGPKSTPPVTAPAEEATVERGEYMANNLAGCVACHTKRSRYRYLKSLEPVVNATGPSVQDRSQSPLPASRGEG
ncbi:MAG: c-type cytochrome [Thermoanaerobaculia bacterium]